MASESISILISADDKASAQLTKVGNSVENLGQRVKQTGGQLKSGTELVGTFANAFGGTVLGSFAGEMAQITERVSAFSEVSKTGRLGALAFKAALAGAVAVTTFKIGQTIGEWVFETQRWKDELKASAVEAARLQGLLDKRQQKGFAEAREDISLVRDPAAREAAAQARVDQLKKEADGLDSRINMAREEVAKRKQNESWYPIEGNWTEERKIAEEQLAQLLKNKDVLEAERQTIADTISERAKSIEARKAENALADKGDAFIIGLRDEIELTKILNAEQAAKIAGDPAAKEKAMNARIALEAGNNTNPQQRGIAEELLKEREQLKVKAEEQKKAEQEADLAAKKEADAIQRAADLEKKRTIDLQARRIELERGKEAAQAFRLEQDGLTKATAQRLAAAEEQQRQAEEAANKAGKSELDTSPQQAIQGRLLRSGTGGDPAIQLATKQVATMERLNRDINDRLDKLYDVSKTKDPYTLKTAVVP